MDKSPVADSAREAPVPLTRPTAMAPDASTSPVGHTPGPWSVDRRGESGGVKFSGYIHCDDATGSAVAMTRFGLVDRSEKETLANARLIAAAPELLAVAQMVVEASDLAGFIGPLGDAARAAIAKARGTTPAPEVSHVG